jgi:hypothetical protein
LRVRPASDSRDPLPETVDDQNQKQKTPRSGGRSKVPSTFPPRAAQRESRSSPYAWALLALLLIGLAGVAALFSRRSGTADATAIGAERRDAGAAGSATREAALGTTSPVAPDPVVEPKPIVEPKPTVEPTPSSEPTVQQLPVVDRSENKSAAPAGRPALKPRPTTRPKTEEPAGDFPNFGGRR